MPIKCRRTYRCVVEGQQEKMYLDHLGKLLTKFPDVVVRFNSSIGNAYELTKSYEEYDKACLFDFDFNKIEFEKNLSICSKLNQKKQKQKYSVDHAYSNVCFDLWLVLHKIDYRRPVNSNDAYVDEVIRQYKLPAGSDIKSAKVMEQILKDITLDDVKSAISRAKEIRKQKLPGDVKRIESVEYYDNPDFSIHSFLEKVLNSISQ